MLVDIIEPKLIVPLGQFALRSLHIIKAHQIKLRQDVGKPVKWSKYTVVPVYHPCPRAAIYRSIADQKGDFSFLGEVLRRRGIEEKLHRIRI